MAAIVWTRRALLQRIRKQVTNERATGDSFEVSDNEISLLIDQETAAKMVGQVYAGAKVEGTLTVPDAYYITYQLPTLTQDNIFKDWYTTLPQPPMSLPLGYSVDRCFFADAANGISNEILPIKAKRTGFRKYMPFPAGASYRIENNTIRISANNASSLLGKQVYISMMSARTTDLDAVMNMSEDDVSGVFMSVTKLLMMRYGVPFDQVQDNLPTGTKPV